MTKIMVSTTQQTHLKLIIVPAEQVPRRDYEMGSVCMMNDGCM